MKSLCLVLFMLLAACASPDRFTQGEYISTTSVVLLDDKFNESDMHLITDKLTTAVLSCEVSGSNNTIVLGNITNQTSEHLNMDSVMDQITTRVVKSKKYTVVDKNSRFDVASEHNLYDRRGQASTKNPLQAHYILTGAISSNVQEFGRDKVVFYKMNMNVIDMNTEKVVCAEEKELRKTFKKKKPKKRY